MTQQLQATLRGWMLTLALAAAPAGAQERSDAAPLPEALRGSWASADSVFEGERFWGGTVLYLMPSGQAALVGAPLPVRLCDGQRCAPLIGLPGRASFAGPTQRLTLVLHGGQKSLTFELLHQADGDVLKALDAPAGDMSLLHRSPTVPSALKAQLGGE